MRYPKLQFHLRLGGTDWAVSACSTWLSTKSNFAYATNLEGNTWKHFLGSNLWAAILPSFQLFHKHPPNAFLLPATTNDVTKDKLIAYAKGELICHAVKSGQEENGLNIPSSRWIFYVI